MSTKQGDRIMAIDVYGMDHGEVATVIREDSDGKLWLARDGYHTAIWIPCLMAGIDQWQNLSR